MTIEGLASWAERGPFAALRMPALCITRKSYMIVSEVMTTQLITVTPNDTLSHAANLLRQHQFHHLPVVRAMHQHEPRNSWPVLEGLITSYDIDLAASGGTKDSSNGEQ